MQSAISSIDEKKSWRRLMSAAVAFGLVSVLAFAQTALAQTTPPLNFGNNFFVTGDYVVAGVGLRGLGDSTGYATGYIQMPDSNSVPKGGVPDGAQIVTALLYWQTVESSQTTYAGQQGFFGVKGGPSHAITGTLLGNPNAPVSWSSGGCTGNSQGSKTIRTYRANVSRFLPVDQEGNVVAGNREDPVYYEVRLADSGSNGAGAPLTLGASLVIVYRLLDKTDPLNSVVIYDGTYSPSNPASTVTQAIEGFYEAAANPISKLTEIVGNGQPNKYESVSLNGVPLPSLYGQGLLPPFPGNYDQNVISPTGGGSWDNPTWIFQSTDPNDPVHAEDSTATTTVTPSASNSGCVSWGAVIFSTTVQDTDKDGLLDKWEKDQGYCDVSVPGNYCTKPTDPSKPPSPIDDPGWVALPGANWKKPDIFVQMDYMCSKVNPDGTCDTTNGGYSFLPKSDAQTMMVNAFSKQGITLHLDIGHAIQEEVCTTDNNSVSPPKLCPAPNQPGVIGWKGGFTLLKNHPLNYPDEDSCEEALDGPCIRRFQHGRKDSYHYALLGHALLVPKWTLLGKTLTSVVQSGSTVTFTTSTPNGLTAYSTDDPLSPSNRVTVSGAISNPSMDGTFYVTSVSPAQNPTSFTVQVPAGTSLPTYTLSTDPYLAVTPGQAGTTSGASDVGGEDSAITLGLWGPDGQTADVQAGVFMHELGHTLGLTHGGTYYTPGSHVPTLEPNCKPNYQSVMNYLFTVDLLGPNQTLDYSEQDLSTLDENGLPAGLTTTDGSPLTYSTTKWYTTSPPGGVGSPARFHCDGTPISGDEVQYPMYRVSGDANPITPTTEWSSQQDVDFNGAYDSSLQGYDDWTHLNLQQMGAVGSLSTLTSGAGPGALSGLGPGALSGLGPGALSGLGPGALSGLGPGALSGLGPGALSGLGPGALSGLGPGNGEITLAVANSVTRPPRDLGATVTRSPTTINLSWTAPTFGQIGEYWVYRGVNGATPTYQYTAGSTSYPDSNVSCKDTYTYFVTAILAGSNPPQESVASNSVTVSNCKVQ